MSNGKKIASIAFTGAAATAATVMAAGPALAASTWHVKNGGTPYKGVVKAKNKAGTSPSLKDTTTGAVLKCKKAFASGSVTNSNPPSSNLGFLKKTTTKWSSCTAATFFHFKAHLTTSPTLVGTSFAGGVAKGHLAGNKISGVISGTSGNTCKATISGTSVPMKYTNANHSFNINSGAAATLTVKHASGNCFGQIATGNHAFFKGIYVVSTPTALSVS